MTAPQLAPGQVVAGRYTLRAMVGFSGESATYQAVASSGHEVVLKLFDPALGQRADVMAKLGQIHNAVAQLPLDVVVPVADSGYDTATSAPYIVSERVQQPSLEALLRQGPVAPLIAGKIVENIARALDACHARQLHHLALKPSNIFVGPAPEYGVRLGDFGASVVRSTSPAHVGYENSVPWSAPEHLQPASALGPAADVFAVALLAFYILTGRSYWESCQSSPPDLRRWQAEVMAPRMAVSQRGAQLGLALPAALDAAFARALSVNPAERPRSALELAHAIVTAAGGTFRSDYAGGQPPATTVAFPEHEAPPPMGNPIAGRGGHPGVPAALGLPPIPPEAQKKTGGAKPILIGISLALLVGGVTAFVLLRPKPAADSSLPSSEPVSVPVPLASPTMPSATGASVEASASAPPSSSADSPPLEPASEKVELLVVCTPACEGLLVDNENVEKIEEKTKVSLLPGKHTLEARRAGYITVKETVDVDKAMQKEVRFFKPGPLPQAPKLPCRRGILKKCP